MSELMPGYRTLRGSDVQRDGMYLELIEHQTGNAVAEVFYSDASGSMSISVFQPEIPLEAIERLIERARHELPPSDAISLV